MCKVIAYSQAQHLVMWHVSKKKKKMCNMGDQQHSILKSLL